MNISFRKTAEALVDTYKAIANNANGGVIEECGHWVFEEKTDFIVQQLSQFCSQHGS
jgi:pimeloyl-ACP methyl ester carboxylesterase